MMSYKKIKAERKKIGLTQKDLAEKIDVSEVAIAKYENGTRNPSDKVKIKLAKVFGKTVGEIFFNH